MVVEMPLWLFVSGPILFIFVTVIAFALTTKREPESVSLALDEEVKYTAKINTIISDWIAEEISRTSMIIETVGFKYTFLGHISTINFKAIGIAPEVEIELQSQLKDTEEIRSYSHFLDLVRTLYLEIDTSILLLRQQRYFLGLASALGPTPYTHDKKQIKYLSTTYPWLWILEAISNHTRVQNFTAQSSSIVVVDKSPQMERGISVPQEDGAIAM